MSPSTEGMYSEGATSGVAVMLRTYAMPCALVSNASNAIECCFRKCEGCQTMNEANHSKHTWLLPSTSVMDLPTIGWLLASVTTK